MAEKTFLTYYATLYTLISECFAKRNVIAYNRPMMKPNKINIFFFLLVFSLSIFNAGCSVFAAQSPTATADLFTSFQSPDGLFSLRVPIGWDTSSTRSSNGTINSYKFMAPDRRGVVEVVVAVRDQPVPSDIALAFTMRVFNSYIVENDAVSILTDEKTVDGRRVFTWHAKQGLMGGKAVLESPGANLFLVAASSLDAASAGYQPLFDQVFSTFKIK